MIPSDAGLVLLPLARGAIAAQLGLSPPSVPSQPWLLESGSAFVTLRLAGHLRGCIGTIESYRSLGEDVTGNARTAAFSDPRFRPLAVDEYAGIVLEVSVLSLPQAMTYADEADLLAQLRPGLDGLLLEADSQRGTFLPQVWGELSEPAEFLGHLKAKIGLARDGWDRDWRFFRYTVRSWSERP